MVDTAGLSVTGLPGGLDNAVMVGVAGTGVEKDGNWRYHDSAGGKRAVELENNGHICHFTKSEGLERRSDSPLYLAI